MIPVEHVASPLACLFRQTVRVQSLKKEYFMQSSLIKCSSGDKKKLN